MSHSTNGSATAPALDVASRIDGARADHVLAARQLVAQAQGPAGLPLRGQPYVAASARTAEAAVPQQVLATLADLALDRDADATQLAGAGSAAALVDRDAADDALAKRSLPVGAQPRDRPHVVDTGLGAGRRRWCRLVRGHCRSDGQSRRGDDRDREDRKRTGEHQSLLCQLGWA